MKKDNGTHRIRKGILAVFMNLILIIFSLSCIFPMIWMLMKLTAYAIMQTPCLLKRKQRTSKRVKHWQTS